MSITASIPIDAPHGRHNGPLTAKREVLTVRQAATYLKLAPRTVSCMAKRGKLPARQIGSMWRFYLDDLENLPVK